MKTKKKIDWAVVSVWIAAAVATLRDVFKDEDDAVMKHFMIRTASGRIVHGMILVDFEDKSVSSITVSIEDDVVLSVANPTETNRPILNKIAGLILEFILRKFWNFADDGTIRNAPERMIEGTEFFNLVASITKRIPDSQPLVADGTALFNKSALSSKLDLVTG